MQHWTISWNVLCSYINKPCVCSFVYFLTIHSQYSFSLLPAGGGVDVFHWPLLKFCIFSLQICQIAYTLSSNLHCCSQTCFRSLCCLSTKALTGQKLVGKLRKWNELPTTNSFHVAGITALSDCTCHHNECWKQFFSIFFIHSEQWCYAILIFLEYWKLSGNVLYKAYWEMVGGLTVFSLYWIFCYSDIHCTEMSMYRMSAQHRDFYTMSMTAWWYKTDEHHVCNCISTHAVQAEWKYGHIFRRLRSRRQQKNECSRTGSTR